MKDFLIVTKKGKDNNILRPIIIYIVLMIVFAIFYFVNKSFKAIIMSISFGIVTIETIIKYFIKERVIPLLKLDRDNFTVMKDGKVYRDYYTKQIKRFDVVSEEDNSIKVVLKEGKDNINNVITIEGISNKVFVQKANELLKKYEDEKKDDEYNNNIKTDDIFDRLDNKEEIYLMFLGKTSIINTNDNGRYELKIDNTSYVFITSDYEAVYIVAIDADISVDTLCEKKFFIVRRDKRGGKIIFRDVQYDTFDPIKVNAAKMMIEKEKKITYNSESIKKENIIEKKLSKAIKIFITGELLSVFISQIIADIIRPDRYNSDLFWRIVIIWVALGFLLMALYIKYLKKRAIRVYEEGEI